MKAIACKESRAVKTSRVFPNDTNNHQTLFGGKLMSWIDDIASISAARHSRKINCDSLNRFCRFSASDYAV
ncbi:hypothetical protein GCM10020331_062870 [Ectobacillus funiculus]